MSGSSANAAARRRRGIGQSPGSNYTTQDNDKNQKIQQSQPIHVPNLTIPQTLMFLDSRLSKIEHKLSSSNDTMLDINGNVDVTLFPQKISNLEQIINTMEQQLNTLEQNITENVITRLNGFTSTISSLETKINNISTNVNNDDGDKVLKEEFNGILSNVGADIGTLTDQVTSLKDLVLNVQNTNILLNSTIIQLSNDCRTANIDNNSIIAIVDENEEQLDIQQEQEQQEEEEQLDIQQEQEQQEEEEQEEQEEEEQEKQEEKIELKINEKPHSLKEEVKEEVKEEINDDLKQKLKMLNSISSEKGTISMDI